MSIRDRYFLYNINIILIKDKYFLYNINKKINITYIILIKKI